MRQDARIEIIIDASLLNHFAENLRRQKSGRPPEEAIAALVATILDGSAYPVAAQRTGARAVRISYRLRSFSQPIF